MCMSAPLTWRLELQDCICWIILLMSITIEQGIACLQVPCSAVRMWGIGFRKLLINVQDKLWHKLWSKLGK